MASVSAPLAIIVHFACTVAVTSTVGAGAKFTASALPAMEITPIVAAINRIFFIFFLLFLPQGPALVGIFYI
jgi:hypothetical protein